MARIYPICSSSSGNCTFIGTSGHGILIDAGCTFRAIQNALEAIDTSVNDIEALFITHEHSDHIKAVPMLAKMTGIPIFASAGTIAALMNDSRNPLPSGARIYDIMQESYQSADFLVEGFATSHDCAQGLGYAVTYAKRRLAVCTDTGFVTPEAEQKLLGCEAVLLESNYDEEMLRRSLRYPAVLKRRIMSEVGHLSNAAAAEFAVKLVESGTKHIILGHLSRENNTPVTAETCVEKALAAKGYIRERDYTLTAAPETNLDARCIALG
ncbi:MAG: MBL fold metallo-hydrolase [Oscillospiraceae bacterium]